MKKLYDHIWRWNRWRKRNINGPVHHLLVLFGFTHSPTFDLTFSKKHYTMMEQVFEDGIKGWNENSTLAVQISQAVKEKGESGNG